MLNCLCISNIKFKTISQIHKINEPQPNKDQTNFFYGIVLSIYKHANLKKNFLNKSLLSGLEIECPYAVGKQSGKKYSKANQNCSNWPHEV